jgi:hypothetical protein
VRDKMSSIELLAFHSIHGSVPYQAIVVGSQNDEIEHPMASLYRHTLD